MQFQVDCADSFTRELRCGGTLNVAWFSPQQ